MKARRFQSWVEETGHAPEASDAFVDGCNAGYACIFYAFGDISWQAAKPEWLDVADIAEWHRGFTAGLNAAAADALKRIEADAEFRRGMVSKALEELAD